MGMFSENYATGEDVVEQQGGGEVQPDSQGGEAAPEQEPTEQPDETQATEQPAPQQQPAPAPQAPDTSWFRPDQVQLKYRGRTVQPRDYNHAVELMQRGWDYAQRMGDLKQQLQQIESMKGKYGQYDQLEQAFQQNPQFRQRIMQLYAEATGQVQPGQQPTQSQLQNDPAYRELYQMMQGMQGQLRTWQESKADQEVEGEIEQLKNSMPTIGWDGRTETGHTLLYDVIQHAVKNRFPNLAAAARDYLWDTHTTAVRAEAAKQAAEQRKANSRAGVVSKGQRPPQRKGQSLSGKSYDELAEMAKQSLGVT